MAGQTKTIQADEKLAASPAATLQIRVHGEASLPTLVYLPGLHGDWTLIAGFRAQLAGKLRFVEFIYPRTLTWSLDEYAADIETALAQHNITAGWLLGESYGSQIAWTLLARKQFEAQGIILAGGFVKHPLPWGVRLMKAAIGRIPFKLLVWGLARFAWVIRLRYRHSPETKASLAEFTARRTELDRQAMRHRLNQIAQFDPREIARNTSLPVYYVSGWLDPLVPWPLVRSWLRKNCPRLRGDKIIATADHVVLGTAPATAARQILFWMQR